MRIELEGYDLIGTPAEMLELLDLLADEVAAVEEPAPEPEAAPTPKPKKPAPKKPAGKKIDWSKAAALRKAGWTYDKIADELGVSDTTVRTYLNKKTTHLI